MTLFVFDFDQTLTSIHVFKFLAGWGAAAAGGGGPRALTERGQIYLAEHYESMGSVFQYDGADGLVRTAENGENWSVAIFGGIDRLELLRGFLWKLVSKNCELRVHTRGYVGAVRRCLSFVGLDQFFTEIWGHVRDKYAKGSEPALPFDTSAAAGGAHPFEGDVSFGKWKNKVSKLLDFRKDLGLFFEDVVFVEDDFEEVELCEKCGAALTVFVEDRRGMTTVEMEKCLRLTK
jgi:hypothetical protein